jgi:hypothetical protein
MVYKGKMNVESIAEWIVKRTSLPTNEIKNYKELTEKVNKVDYLIVYVGPTDGD